MKDLGYRKATKDDILSIANIITALLGTCNLNGNKSATDNNIQEISKTINMYYVCEIDNKIIGACGLSNLRSVDSFNLGLSNVREIFYLVVDKNYQGNGIGTNLLNLCCKNVNNDIIYDACGDNGEYVNSKFVLEKCGFELYKNLGTSYYKDNNYCFLCVNNNKNCNSCLAEIWIKKANS